MGLGTYQPAPVSAGLDDLLGLGSDGLLGDIGGATSPPTVMMQASGSGQFVGGIPPSSNSPFGAPLAPILNQTPPLNITPPNVPVPAVNFTTGPPIAAPNAAAAISSANPFSSLSDIFGTAPNSTPVFGSQVGYVAPKSVYFGLL
ncbi:unnamed protein product [Anisakis simplex]|uniref:Clathrin coat assembly protein AP180 n=1 Tax=Anisakis simplex TaxID=6269 RepID=A0A0M3JH68_ANISI|nr:unnamed protein product [Anisakis simplex]